MPLTGEFASLIALFLIQDNSSYLELSIRELRRHLEQQAASESVPASAADQSINTRSSAGTSSAPELVSQSEPEIIILQGDVAIKPNKSFRFVARVRGVADDKVIWSIRESSGGGAISAEGIYSSPSMPGVYHVAASSAALGKSDEVTVRIVDTIPWLKITPPISLDFNNPPDNYGAQIILSSRAQPTTLYLGTNYQGIWKSFNSGKTWFKANIGLPSDPANIYFNNDGSPAGSGGNCSDISGRNWAMAIDPTDSEVVYTADGYGCAQGIWKTTNGGATWQQMFSHALIRQSTNDVGSIEIDLTNHLHIIAGSHSSWSDTPEAAGVWESWDGGHTWKLHRLPQAAGSKNHYAAFLNSKTWILITQDSGIWRTTDNGATWSKVSSFNKPHGGSSLYRAQNGVFYLGGNGALLRSTDFGLTWSDAGAPHNQDGYMGIVGDGNYIYAATANTGMSSIGPVQYYYASESDGTNWKPYGAQKFGNGPMSMTYDAQNGVVYSSNWGAGVWKLTGR